MNKTSIYIGSNNETKIVEIEKIETIIAQYVQNFTIINGTGYYKGTKESMVIVEIIGDYNIGILQTLKRELQQETIMVTEQFLKVNFI